MPPATQLRSGMIDHRAVVSKVLKCRPEILAKRNDIVKIPSIMRAEFTREREKLEEFRSSLKTNMKEENDKQRAKFNKIKAKYDREGVEVIEDES